MSHQENLKAYLDGELSASETAALEAALRSDAKLARELDDLRKITASVRSIPEPVPYGLEQAIWKLEKLDKKSSSRIQWGRWAGVGLTGACAVVLAMVLFFPKESGSMAKSVATLSDAERKADSLDFETGSIQSTAKAPATGSAMQKGLAPQSPAAGFVAPKPMENRVSDAVGLSSKDAPRADRAPLLNKPLNGEPASVSKPAPVAPADAPSGDVKAESQRDNNRTAMAKAVVGLPMKSVVRNRIEPIQTVHTASIDATKAELARIVHSLNGTINLGQPKDSPLTATISIPDNRIEEFNRAFEDLTKSSLKAAADANTFASPQARGGLAGGGAGASGGPAGPGAPSVSRQEPREQTKMQAANRPKPSRVRQTFKIQLLPAKE